MNQQKPTILILDDEEVQRMTVCIQLKGLGAFVQFDDPELAIGFLRENRVDAAVVDIHMPGKTRNGEWFLREVRSIDKCLGVILRTADEDVSIAQLGIETRAVQRVIKSQPNAKEVLRSAVQSAISETIERRRAETSLAEVEITQKQLVSALARTDDEITTSELCIGFIRGLNPIFTAISGYSELIVQHATSMGDPRMIALAAENRATAVRGVLQLQEFQHSPYIEGFTVSPPTAYVNACVDALSRLFQGHSLFAGGHRKFNSRGLQPDFALIANPTRLLSALRHLVEYCALLCADGQPIALTCAHCEDASRIVNDMNGGLVLNPRFAANRPCVVVSVAAEIGLPSIETLRASLRQCSSDPRIGNLLVVAAATIDDRLALTIVNTKRGTTVFDLFIPTAG